MPPSPFLPAVIAEINRLDRADRELAAAPRLTASERRRRAGHLARLRRVLRQPDGLRSELPTTR